MWARQVLQLPAVGGRMPTEHGLRKYSTHVVRDSDSTLVPTDLKPYLIIRGICPHVLVKSRAAAPI